MNRFVAGVKSFKNLSSIRLCRSVYGEGLSRRIQSLNIPTLKILPNNSVANLNNCCSILEVPQNDKATFIKLCDPYFVEKSAKETGLSIEDLLKQIGYLDGLLIYKAGLIPIGNKFIYLNDEMFMYDFSKCSGLTGALEYDIGQFVLHRQNIANYSYYNNYIEGISNAKDIVNSIDITSKVNNDEFHKYLSQ